MAGFGENKNKKKNKQSIKTISMPSNDEIIDYAIKLQLKGDIHQASKYYKYCIENGINDSRVLCNYGLILRSLGDLENAQIIMKKSIAMFPCDALSYNNLSGILQELGQYNEAELILKKCLKIDRNNSITYTNLGTVLMYQGKLDHSIVNLKKALSINPREFNAYLSLGIVMRQLGKIKEALEYIYKSIEIQPKNFLAYCNLGDIFSTTGEYKKAISIYEKALNLSENNVIAKIGLIHCKGIICDWSNNDSYINWIDNIGIKGEPVNPYTFFLYDENPINHLKRSKKFANQHIVKKDFVRFQKIKEEKIRIGYFSADFRDHPVTHVISSFLGLHDKNIFKIYLYSFTPIEDCYTNNLKKLGLTFKNIKELNESETIELVRSDKLDIAIDLMGYTDNNRSFIFTKRIATLQINYLGCPGTLGSKSYDFIIGDKIIIGKKEERFYIEKVLRLKHYFPPNSCFKDISKEKIFYRKDFKIPENAFVFTCFNANKKITKNEFDIWMNLLYEIKDGILWLCKSNKFSEINLKKEAVKRNIDPARLFFAERLKNKEKHLARYTISDLGLDTFNYNGHTTTSDALWTGLPVLTKIGKSFSSRVSASILKSFELDELITSTEKGYEEKALFLAKNRNQITKIKDKLRFSKDFYLMRSKNYVKDLENLYMKIIK